MLKRVRYSRLDPGCPEQAKPHHTRRLVTLRQYIRVEAAMTVVD